MARPIDKKSAHEAIKYKSMGLGVRQISRMMKKDPTQILRWLNYPVHKLIQMQENQQTQGVDKII